jgi:hypothetical protein
MAYETQGNRKHDINPVRGDSSGQSIAENPTSPPPPNKNTPKGVFIWRSCKKGGGAGKENDA